MNIALFLKKNITKMPFYLGNITAKIPYSIRPGISSTYNLRVKEIREFEDMSNDDKEIHLYKQMKNITIYAYENIQFYKEYYLSKEFNPKDDLNSFEDIKKIPIINKDILRKYDTEDRSGMIKNRYKVNTGGSSGSPFSFYITPDSMGTEWAHMHNIWKNLDFVYCDLKVVFGGRSDVSNGIEYDSLRHSYAIDLYTDYNKIYNKIFNVFKTKPIKYFHGYPSAIYDFVLFLEQNEELLNIVKSKVKGVFFGSEFPIPLFRDKIEKVLNVKTISWYGHTERTILAGEKEVRGRYYPFQTYGYTEAVTNSDNTLSLVGTSFYNLSSPFIRYNTDDTVSDVTYLNNKNILESFTILDGRKGDFILDKKGKSISLTGLIFGRHHEIFDFIKYLQIGQNNMGFATIYYVANEVLDTIKLFDSSNIDIKFSFVRIDSPFRTKAGKILLKIKEKNENTVS